MSQEVTQLLHALRDGDQSALERLMPLVYDELRAIAARHLHGERPGHTLQPTALANEAYLRLMDRQSANWDSRAHFFGVAAQAIRRILVEHARAKGRDKRGGGRLRVTLSDSLEEAGRDVDVLALDDALERLGSDQPEDRKVVVLRYFGGLSVKEVAAALGVSERTVHRRWEFARSWLYRELSGNTTR